MKIGHHVFTLVAVIILAFSVRAEPAGKGPVKVFILAGQSNMEGAGAIKADPQRNEGKGSLEYLVKDPATADRFKHLVDRKGDWAVRDDVWIWYFDRKGGLTTGYGARKDCIGPELQFGHVVGDHYEEQVLLIKIAWGGKSLAQDFRPPSSGGEVGPYYKELLQHVRDVLGNLKKHFPEYRGQGYEIAGFGWHQGWNDRINQAFNDEYETNLANFIRDIRKELEVDKLPFVIAETGMSGHEEKHPRALSLMRAQAAVAKYEEFKGNVAFVETKDFYRPPEVSPSKQGYHWNNNAETYFLIGDAMGRAMIELAEPAPAAEQGEERTVPDFTRGDTIPETAPHDWNLGPTGARGWIYSDRMETSDARQVYVTQVEKGSPADGVLEKGDVILGVGGNPFSFDPRTEIGKAVTRAESAGGALSLIRWRQGKTRKVSLRLPVLGSYSATAPFDCAKSKRIFEQGCRALAGRMEKNPDRGNPIERSLNALALLSSGKREYLPLVKRQVEWASKYSDLERKTLHSWFYGFVNMLVAEYVLATDDRTFMPDLERITMEIVHGQSVVGSWGHRFIQRENGRLAGYGMMNAPGLPLTISLILAREAGVSDPALDEAIAKSARLIRFYVGKGSVPYGDHHPWIDTHEDNGKNGAAALMFNLLGDAGAAEYFSRMSVASHGAERDTGHTGNFFNMLWAMPGVSLSGPQASGAWMEEFGWYYDLSRRWDGTFLHQGAPEKGYDSYRNWDSTGAYLLAYGLPLKTILLTGRKSVVPQVDAAGAERLIADGRGWSPKHRIASYSSRSDAEILAGLKSWSPVVRERSATELANRRGDPTARLIEMLAAPDLDTRYGACQALIMLEKRAAPAVQALEKTLAADDLWLRIKAAEVLAAIGPAAFSTVPTLLAMLAERDPESDPRGMQQRYLCFALFNRRDGMLGRSLEGVDRQALYAAVLAGLQNEDGRARGSIESVYGNLSYNEIEPILPAIHQAVVEPAPSGIMFADGIRLSGLEVLAKHRIAEGLPLCIALIDPDRWGTKNRIKRCLNALSVYGGAAKSQIPRIQELEKALKSKNWKPAEIEDLDLPGIIKAIRSDRDPPALRPLNLPKDKAGAADRNEQV